jgi:hypothetical protein
MALKLSEDEIDDLLYFARTGDAEEFESLKNELCKRGEWDVAELIKVARDEESGNGVLHMAAANGYYGISSFALLCQLDLFSKLQKILTDKTTTALILSICKSLSVPSPQNPPMLAILNAQNKAGNTALHWAALNGHLEAVKVLLEQGGDPTITNQRGHDAVYEAEINDKKEVVEWVLKEGGEGLESGVGGDGGEDTADAKDEEVEMGDGEGDLKEQMEKLGVSGGEEKP